VNRLFLAVAAAASCSLPAVIGCSRREPAAESKRPNVLLVTIDTFRADRLSQAVTPAIEALAASGLRFTNARTAVPLTLPAHTTILTGLLPPVHGVRANGSDRLSETHPTLATILKTAGYRTAAFVGAFVLDRRFGLARGFDSYDDRIDRDPNAADKLEAERPASAVVDRALAWLEHVAAAGAAPPDPFFIWIHLYDPHAPYRAPAAFVARARQMGATPGSAVENRDYDAEVMYADAQISRVFDWLRARDLVDRTVIVVAGDHGEGLGEHGEQTHGMLLYDGTLRVPLVVSRPGSGAATRSDAVSLVDVAPTILRSAGLTPPPEMSGRDLTAPVRSGDIYAETDYPLVAGWSPLQALTDGRWKIVRGGLSIELYDLERDAGERHDLSAAQTNTARAMATRIDSIHGASTPSSPAAASTEAAERLRALGYVMSSARSDRPVETNPATEIDVWSRFEDALAGLNANRPGVLERLKSIAADHPDGPVFQMTYARALHDRGRMNEALDVYRRAATRWPGDAALLHDLAVTARDASSVGGADARSLQEEAFRAERAAIAAAPANAAAHNGLGLLDVDAGNSSGAASEFERATVLDPNNASYWVNLGNARRAAADRAAATHAYQQALAIQPSNPDALNGAGVLLVEGHRPAEAAALFARAANAAPDFIEARLNLGIALEQSGQPTRAADAYRRVLATPGSHPREKQAAARLLSALGAAR